MELKWGSRHTFLISAGIILLGAGIYPYMDVMVFGIVPFKYIVHMLGAITGLMLVAFGIHLWSVKDADDRDILKFKKDEMKRANQMKELEIEFKKLELKKAEIQAAKEQAAALGKAVPAVQIQNAEKIMKDIVKQKGLLLDKVGKLYSERTTQLKDLPAAATLKPDIIIDLEAPLESSFGV